MGTLLFSSFKYNDEWAVVEKEASVNPKTALQKVDAIRKQAVKDDNGAQQLRCILTSNALNANINEVTFADQLKELHDFQKQTSDKVALAVARYLESNLYWQKYERNRWKIDRRKELTDFVPDDVEEWSANLFKNKVRELRKMAMEEPKVRTTLAADYEPLLVLKEDSRVFRPSLFDLMAYYNIERSFNLYTTDECLQFYADVAALHKEESDKSAYVLALLDAAHYKFAQNQTDREQYLAELNKLHKEYNDDPVSVLVRIYRAEALMDVVNQGEEERRKYGADPADIVSLCQEGIDKFPKHPKVDVLKSKIAEIKSENVSIGCQRYCVHTGDNIKVNVSYANISKLKLKLMRYKCTPEELAAQINRKLPKTNVNEYEFNLTPSNFCITNDTVVEIPAQEPGAYEISFGLHRLKLVVSDHFVFSTEYLDAGKNNYVVVDGNSGAPLQGVNLSLFDAEPNPEKLIGQGTTDNNGFAFISAGDNTWRRYLLFAKKGNDVNWQQWSYGVVNPLTEINKKQKNVVYGMEVFTDRAIYRPGQTVYFKAIYFSSTEKGVKVLPAKKLKATLSNRNGEVKTIDLQTNEFGSAAGSFVLPAGGLMGNYEIVVSSSGCDGFKSLRVEEYKRPTFETALQKPDGSFSFGDDVIVRGSASYLLGTPVQGGKVSYTVERRANWWFRWLVGSAADKVVASGETNLDDEGKFFVNFVPEKPSTDKGKVCYNYVVNAKVTDVNGETQEEEMTITVGDVSMAIVCPVDERVEMDKLSGVKFCVMNLSQQLLAKEVFYKVESAGVVVAQGKLMSNVSDGFALALDTKKWTSGQYKFTFSADDDKGRTVSSTYETVLYRNTDKRPAVKTPLWTENTGSLSVAPGQEQTVRIGTSFDKAHLLVVAYDRYKQVRREWVKLSNEIKTFKFALNDNDEVLNVQFYLVHEGQFYSASVQLNRKPEDKTLPLKLTVFRDKVQPGADEKWQIQLPAGKAAELVATMYDASLDQFSENYWNKLQTYRRAYSFPIAKVFYINGDNIYYRSTYLRENLNLYFDTWREYGFRRFPGMVMMTMANKDAVLAKAAKDPTYNDYVVEDAVEVAEEALAPQASPASAKGRTGLKMAKADNGGGAEKQAPKVRSNFAETAFFYPQLSADADGVVNLNFTMPESLTKWKLMAMAHTKDLFCGQLVQEVVSQKDFMVQPNYPRFFRHGDEVVLSAKVVNLTENATKGKARLQLLNPVTEKVILERVADFDLQAGKNGAVEWRFEVPRNADAVLVRVMAEASDFTDAEQKLLPVLTNRVVVTQSVPMYVRGGQTKDFVLNNLVANKSKSVDHKFLKLELAANPVWYAVQALPSVANVDHENAVTYSAALFAAQMANHIALSNQRIFNVIDSWKKQGHDKQTLLSNLEKNPEVKNLLLNETPWVLDAKNETENKQRLASLFDVNTLKDKAGLWQDKLFSFQDENGGFPWFKGMEPNFFTTLFVLDNYGRLQQVGIDTGADKQRIEKAVRFLDSKILRQYNWLKEHDHLKDAYISTSELYYFQVRGMYTGIKIAEDAKKAYDFYFDLLKKQWTDLGLQGKALAAIDLYQDGEKTLAQQVVRSLREFSTSSDEMGMYWKSNVSGYLWQDAAIATHTRIMEALQLVDFNSAEQDELRIWLLNQKRTQNWGNTIANIDALKVLLLNNQWIDQQNEVTVKMAGKKVVADKAEIGTGYCSTFVDGSDVKPEMGRVQLASSEGGNLSWGALYWQFEEDMDQVKGNKTGLNIEKTVMLQTVNGEKKALASISDKTKLKVGDVLSVRLVLRADRDFDYVSLRDQRASCLEPLQQLSGYRWSERVGYYQMPKDAAMYYFFDHLPKGTYVFEYPLVVTNKGSFSNGITEVQCMYAPDFGANTGSVKINVTE